MKGKRIFNIFFKYAAKSTVNEIYSSMLIFLFVKKVHKSKSIRRLYVQGYLRYTKHKRRDCISDLFNFLYLRLLLAQEINVVL